MPQSTKEVQFFDIGTKDYMAVRGKAIRQRDAFVVAIESAQRAAYRSVDFILVMRNWLLGKRIAEENMSAARVDRYGEGNIVSALDCSDIPGTMKSGLKAPRRCWTTFPELTFNAFLALTVGGVSGVDNSFYRFFTPSY